jgi:fructokinase
MDLLGGIEAGGTKFVCGIGTGPDDIEVVAFPTVSPDDSIRRAVTFFRDAAGSRLSSLGIASFGPIDLDQKSSSYGRMTTTPKAAWRNFDIVGAVAKAFPVPIALETDVNAAALAEGEWGAARDVDDYLYITVGTGIGGGVVVRRRPVHGLMHPEIGHLYLAQREDDSFAGICPFHGKCLEGLASGPALAKRWGCPPETLPAGHRAWELEAHYLSMAVCTLVCALCPHRFVVGGGVMHQDTLLPMIRRNVARLLNGYIEKSELREAIDAYIVSPRLGSHSGVLGAMLLAGRLLQRRKR